MPHVIEQKVPTDLQKALNASQKVTALWKELTPIARRDFISWIEEAKQLTTRARRIAVTCDKLLSGKRRPCCYALVPMNLYKALGEDSEAKASWKILSPDGRRDLIAKINKVNDPHARAQQIQKSAVPSHGIHKACKGYLPYIN
jgi:uncharacterized protein YdeI (YjbR/CyaY-like superfamily)